MTMAILMIVGVPFFAEQSLPGDLAYGVKTGVNERIFDAITSNKESESLWDIRKEERRMEELEQLASRDGY